MADAPRYRVWQPVALGWALIGAFVVWNGWGLLLMARRTAMLPGGSTRQLLDRGPFRLSRNPLYLYLGLIALHIGTALLWPSVWALLVVPVGVGLLTWGAIIPEERYLSAKFGAEYLAYTHRVRRWL